MSNVVPFYQPAQDRTARRVARFVFNVRMMREKAPLPTARAPGRICSRCKRPTNQIEFLRGENPVDHGVCPLCAIRLGRNAATPMAAVFTQVIQLMDAGISTLPALIETMHRTACTHDPAALDRQLVARVFEECLEAIPEVPVA